MTAGYLRRLQDPLASGAELWWADLDAYALCEALDGFSAEELERAARMRLERDAGRYLAGRHALRRVLAMALGRPPRSLVIERDALGKPRLPAGTGLQFSLSRSGTVCLIGVSRHLSIGVDVEAVRPIPDADGLADSQLTRNERQALADAIEPGDTALLTCWTRKEACLKALGVGLLVPAATVDAGVSRDLREVSVDFRARRCAVSVRSLDIARDAAAAVALADPRDAQAARDALLRS